MVSAVSRPGNQLERSLAGDRPLIVPCLVLFEELRQPRVHWNGRIRVDAVHLHADAVARQSRQQTYSPS